MLMECDDPLEVHKFPNALALELIAAKEFQVSLARGANSVV